jgi:hypothetical protein
MRKNLFIALILSLFLVGCQEGGDIDFDIENENGKVPPVETFDLIDIRYEFLPGDSFTITPVTVWRRRTINDTNSPVQSTISVSDTIRNWSLFSEIDKNIVSNIRVRIPLIANDEIDTSVLLPSNWTFTNGITEFERRYTGTTEITSEIPPRTTVIQEFIVTQYFINITYIATLRSRFTGQRQEVVGTWRSVMRKYSAIHTIISPNGEVIAEHELQSFDEQ